MDYHEGLLILTANPEGKNAEDFDGMLDELVQKVNRLLPTEVREEIEKTCKDENNSRGAYLKAVLYFLNGIKNSIPPDSGTFLSVNQISSVRTGIEIAISMIIPCLLPGVGVGIQHLCPSAAKIPTEELADLQKYGRLSAVVRTIMDCFDDIVMRPAVLPQLGPLLAALLQLSTAPLMKPCREDEKYEAKSSHQLTTTSTTAKFNMSLELYKQLKTEQDKFKERLVSLINVSPQSAVIKELMIILGMQGAPNWLKRETRRFLIDRIMKPGGIAALTLSICDGGLDLGVHWSKLDVIAKLIATPQSADPDMYYSSICSQLLDLLDSKVRDSLIVANWCINALYEKNSTVFTEKLFNSIAAPLLSNTEVTESSKILKNETEVTKCIENLSKCFITHGAKFKCLPIKLLCAVAVPLFRLYNKAYRTVYAHRNSIQQLLLLLLNEESVREDLFAQFLDKSSSSNANNFGNNLTFQFGPNGGFEITNQDDNPNCEESGDCLLSLVQSDKKLSYNLFCYLLKSLSSYDQKYTAHNANVLISDDDRNIGDMHNIEMKLVYAKLLSILAETSAIQEAHVQDPEHLLSFVKSLIREKSQSDKQNRDDIGTEFDVLYISLMLIKVILSNRPKAMIEWKPFNELMISLHEMQSFNTRSELLSLAKEVETLIKTQGASARPRYQDLSEKSQSVTEFDRALQDLADPLLPVRAHGLMSLTKLIERNDPDVIAKKDIILCLFQENLKHEDSFIYLSAINGIATLATSYPQKVIELLVREFIDVTSASKESTISPDTRAKIGEILVRVTRSLGELAPAYKNILINGFLCGTRDVDPLVRASSLSCLGELCKVLGYRLGNIITEVIFCIGSIIKTDKSPECRRAGVLVTTLMLQGLGKSALMSLGSDLLPLYRALLTLRDHDEDPVLRVHAQLAVDELDDIVRNFLFAKPKLEKSIFLLEPTI